MSIKLSGDLSNGNGPKVAVRCPACGHFGTFETVGVSELYDRPNARWFGQRRCPNSKCGVHIFYVLHSTGDIITFPQETIGFDKSGIPDNVLNAFEEAIKCHSNQCFIAAAIMIRKTLEEICADRKATGDNLKKRLKDLGTKIFIPDAAHIESTTFNDIGKQEIEVSIEFAKEILKGVYQYEGLLNKLRGLKKPSS